MNISHEFRCQNSLLNINKPDLAIYAQVGFIPGMQIWSSSVQKSITINHYINKLKKNHIIISTDAENTVDKIQNSFMKKKKNSQENQEQKGTFSNGNSVCKKSAVNIILNGERLNGLHLRLGRKQGCLVSLFLFYTVLKVLANTFRQKKKKKNPF